MTLKGGLLSAAYHGFDPEAAMSLRPRDICARITALSSFVTHNRACKGIKLIKN